MTFLNPPAETTQASRSSARTRLPKVGGRPGMDGPASRLVGLVLAATAFAIPARVVAEVGLPVTVPETYRHPILAIPYAWEKPTIDGIVDDAEWQGAASFNALQTTGKQISTRQTRFWIMWDEENFYVAMRDPLRQGERPIQSRRGREPGKDLDVIFDDCYEIWLSVGATDTLTGQPDCSTQFLGNFAGGRYDAIHQPAVGNSRTSSYDTDWEPVSRLTDDNVWQMEVVIPRASLGTTERPFHEGMRMRALFARNYKRPWEQNSFEGTSSFSVVDTHSEFILSKRAPALHLLGVGDAERRSIGLRLAAYGQTDADVVWQYRSDAVSQEGRATVKKGEWNLVLDEPALDEPGNGELRMTVTDADGGVLLDWAALRQFRFHSRMVEPAPGERRIRQEYNPATETLADRGDALDLRLTYNPEKDYARVFGDFINYDNRADIHEIVIRVSDEAGSEIKRATTQLDEDAYAKAVLHFDALNLGTYTVRLECLDAEGSLVAGKDSIFTKENLAEKYDWWQTDRGSIETVVSPWTPVTLKDGVFGVWGREMTVGTAGLPAKVTTQGIDILAAPGQLLATLENGQTLAASGAIAKTVFDEDYRKIVEVDSTLGNIAIQSRVRMEFDGMYKVTLTLTPERPVVLKNLKLVLPYTEEMGEYIHAVTAEIRSAYWYGFVPKTAPATLTPGPSPGGRGGGESVGRVWASTDLADKTMRVGSFIPYVWLGSTKGGLCWFADSDEGWMPNDDVPAIEIQRNQTGQVDLVFNLIGAEATLDAPRTITFALQASPVKAMPANWREYNWWCGDTFKNYAHAQNLIFASVPFVVPEYAEKAKEIVEAQHKAERPAVPYFIHTQLPGHLVPEMGVFAEQWRTTVDDALCYGGSLNDYMVYHWSRWAEEYDIDGYYIDNMRPIACDNIEAGRGYRLPDGRIQPSFQMFDTRDYFLRSRALFLEQRPQSMLVIHMTNSMIIPWVGPADIAYDGEHHVIYPEMGKTFMDFWSLERLRVDFPGQWGVAVDFMHEYQGAWDQADLHRVKRAYFAAVLLHDALPYGNNNGHARNLIAMRRDFGIGEDDVRFLPYWDESGLTTTGDDIKLAGWLKPDKLLLLVANFGEKQIGQVTIDTAKLGWGGATFAVLDAEQGYRHLTNRRVALSKAELAEQKTAFEKREANRLDSLRLRHERQVDAAKNAGQPLPEAPDLNPGPYSPNPWRNERVTAWDGDLNPPVEVDGSRLAVPVERHNYRLLVIEKK